MRSELNRVISFLVEIGLQAYVEPGATGFIEDIRIDAGTLYLDPDCHVSGLLHEAGHLAITPKIYRHWMTGNLFSGMRNMLDDTTARSTDPDSPIFRAVIQCSDPEATAWAWAAGIHLGIAPEKIIMDHEYDGAGADIRFALSLNRFIGINGLRHAGFCATSKRSARPAECTFPNLNFWLQNADHAKLA